MSAAIAIIILIALVISTILIYESDLRHERRLRRKLRQRYDDRIADLQREIGRLQGKNYIAERWGWHE